MKLVMIEWEDSCSELGWHKRDVGLDIVAHCVSVGILTQENSSGVTISHSMSSTTGSICDAVTIPRGCIKRIRKLKVS